MTDHGNALRSIASEPHTIDPEKYSVFKTRDLLDMFQGLIGTIVPATSPNEARRGVETFDMIRGQLGALRLDDSVVIRHSDVFAADALLAYANTIITAIGIMEHYGVGEHDRAHLIALADYFTNEAYAARQTDVAIPD